MAAPAPVIDNLLVPISEEHPAGEDITFAPEWQAINQARRRDKLTGRQDCDWPAVHDLLTDALAHKSKDLRLGVWLMEANIEMRGFDGLRESIQLLRGLITTFWDTGLYPEIAGGDLQYRAMPLEWLGGDNLPRAIRQISLTARTDGGRNFSYLDYRQSREIGWEKDILNSTGDIIPDKESRRKASLADGGVSAEMFEEALKTTRRAGVEPLYSKCEAAWEEFQTLDQKLDEKFGVDAPSTSEAREAFEDCRRFLGELVKRKRQEEPDPSEAPQGTPTAATGPSFSVSTSWSLDEADGAGSWVEAEEMVRQGRVQEGLAQMTALSARQYGRIHFHHRLRLAEICLDIRRDRLAIAILEELAKSIDEFHLEKWESPALLGKVWGRLYRCYKSAEPGSEQSARAVGLFDRLCRLDPWQALRWDE